MIMKKNLLTMLAAILFCGYTVTWLSACSSDNDDKTETPQEQTVKMFYVVEVSDDVLKVADVEVNYVDQTGAKQKEVLTSKKWIKALDTKTLPLTEGLWAKITPKRLPLPLRLPKRWLPGAPRALLWALPSATKAMPNRHQ